MIKYKDERVSPYTIGLVTPSALFESKDDFSKRIKIT